jgi:hypothetical protein
VVTTDYETILQYRGYEMYYTTLFKILGKECSIVVDFRGVKAKMLPVSVAARSETLVKGRLHAAIVG